MSSNQERTLEASDVVCAMVYAADISEYFQG